jgi:hypothetical protein
LHDVIRRAMKARMVTSFSFVFADVGDRSPRSSRASKLLIASEGRKGYI